MPNIPTYILYVRYTLLCDYTHQPLKKNRLPRRHAHHHNILNYINVPYNNALHQNNSNKQAKICYDHFYHKKTTNK